MCVIPVPGVLSLSRPFLELHCDTGPTRISAHLTDVRTRFILVCKSCGQSCMGVSRTNFQLCRKSSIPPMRCYANQVPSMLCGVFCQFVYAMLWYPLYFSYLLGNLCCCLECANQMIYDSRCSLLCLFLSSFRGLSAGVSARSLQCSWHLSYHAFCSG